MKVEGGDAGWLSARERGSVGLLRFSFALATLFGRTVMKLPVSVVAFWYRLFDRRAVWASKEWLTRLDGTPPGFWRVYRHIRAFSQVTLDKVFLIKGKTRGFEFRRTGDHLLAEQVATGRGAVLLGAHLGSYEAMRAGGTADDVPIKILGYFENARTINALLEKLNPEHAAKVIHIGSDPVGVMAKVKDRLEDGELVALLGDRVGLNERTVTVPFFGSDARFPAGPFLLASLLRCPVYLVFGLYHPPNRYDLYCEPFADKIELPRKNREAALQACVESYARRLEHYCRKAPDNWFNFFDFWSAK